MKRIGIAVAQIFDVDFIYLRGSLKTEAITDLSTCYVMYIADSLGLNLKYLTIPYRNHDSRWVLQNIPERKVLRDWVNGVFK